MFPHQNSVLRSLRKGKVGYMGRTYSLFPIRLLSVTKHTKKQV
jgi:hypothetical protein